MISMSKVAFLMLYLILLLSFFFGAYALEIYGIQYVSEGGSPINKIHLYSYVGILLFVLYTKFEGFGKYKKILGALYFPWLLFLISICYLVVYGLFKQGASGMAYVVDTLLVPALIFPVAMGLSEKHKKMLLGLLTILMLINSVTALMEYLLRSNFWGSSSINFDYFRSTGWLSHPLNNALIMCSIFPILIRFKLVNSYLFLIMTVLALFAFGARTATVIFSLVISVLIFMELVDRFKKSGASRSLAFLGAAIFVFSGVLLIISLPYFLGVGSRIFENLTIDNSGQARFDALLIFNHLSVYEYFFGASKNILDNMVYYINNEIVENYFMGWFLSYGLLGMLPLMSAFLYFIYRIYGVGDRYIKSTIVIFFIVSISNNSLVTKTPALVFLFVAISCFIPSSDRRSIALLKRIKFE